jgi:hypothetical protein
MDNVYSQRVRNFSAVSSVQFLRLLSLPLFLVPLFFTSPFLLDLGFQLPNEHGRMIQDLVGNRSTEQLLRVLEVTLFDNPASTLCSCSSFLR